MIHYPKMKRRDWVKHCNIADVVRLAQQDKIPQVIEGFMLDTAAKHLLRCIYGSDLRAATALFWHALWKQAARPFNYLNWLLHRKQWEDESIAEEMEEIADEVKGGE